MTPEEKAVKLVQKYKSVLSNFKQSDYRRQNNYGKLAATICVDEIITSCTNTHFEKEYWQQVKEEINKL